MISDIRPPESRIAREAQAWARAACGDMLFNHVMRSYWFGALFAQAEGAEVDGELMFLSAVLHDLGLTEAAQGPHRFEIEGAGAARAFLVEHGVARERAQRVWDDIALHVWDLNLFRDDTSRLMQLGILHDVVGVAEAPLDPADVAEVLRRHPRLDFKRAFDAVLTRELDAKAPYPHVFHICTHIAQNRAPVPIPDAPALLDGAPFRE